MFMPMIRTFSSGYRLSGNSLSNGEALVRLLEKPVRARAGEQDLEGDSISGKETDR